MTIDIKISDLCIACGKAYETYCGTKALIKSGNNTPFINQICGCAYGKYKTLYDMIVASSYEDYLEIVDWESYKESGEMKAFLLAQNSDVTTLFNKELADIAHKNGVDMK